MRRFTGFLVALNAVLSEEHVGLKLLVGSITDDQGATKIFQRFYNK